MKMRSSASKRARAARRPLALQIAASLGAAVCVAALFGSSDAPPPAPVQGDIGKSAHRIADAQSDTTVVQFDPQQQALMASLQSFQPKAAPEPLPALVASNRPKIAIVRPPPRPVFATPATPAAGTTVVAATAPAPQGTPASAGWRVAGVEIPGSAQVRRYVPNGSDLLRTGDAAWTASTTVVKKVAGLGSLFGL